MEPFCNLSGCAVGGSIKLCSIGRTAGENGGKHRYSAVISGHCNSDALEILPVSIKSLQ